MTPMMIPEKVTSIPNIQTSVLFWVEIMNSRSSAICRLHSATLRDKIRLSGKILAVDCNRVRNRFAHGPRAMVIDTGGGDGFIGCLRTDRSTPSLSVAQ